MSLAVDALTHALDMLRPRFSDHIGIIIMFGDGVNMAQIAGVRRGPHCAPQPLHNEGSQALSLVSTGDRWPRILAILTILMPTFPIFFNTFWVNLPFLHAADVNYDIKS